MTQSSNKFEALLELLINEENDKAEQLFHEIVVEKSRDIYENLASTETKDDSVDENKEDKDEAVKETEKSDTTDEEVKETEKSDKDETVEETVDEVKADESKNEVKDEEAKTEATTSEEEKIEEIGGDATDDLVKDISSDEEGDADAAADELAPDMAPTDGEPEGDTEERVSDLEDALDELKAEFEKMMGHEVGDGEEGSEEESLQVQPEVAPQIQPTISNRPFEGKKAEAKETVKEYKIQKSADTGDHADNKKSAVASNAKAPNSASSHKIGGKEETGRTAPSTSDVRSGEFANEGGKDSRKLSDASSKVSKTDGADNKKSPVVQAKK